MSIEGSGAWGNAVSGHGTWYSGVTWSLDSATATTATYTAEVVFKSNWGYDVYGTYRIWANWEGESEGSAMDTGTVDTTYSVPYGGTDWLVVASKTFTVKRRSADQKMWFGGAVAFTGGYDDGYSAGYSSGTVRKTNSAPSISAAQVSGKASAKLTVSGYTGTGIIIQRKAKSATNWTQVYSGTSTSYTDACGAGTWDYRVDQTDSWGTTSAWSSTAEKAIVALPSAPSVTAVAQVSGTTNAKATITVNATNAASMQVERKASSASSWTTIYNGSPTTSVTDACGAGTWQYRAKNTNAAGSSSYSSTASVTVVGAPSAPTISAARAGGTSIALTLSSAGTALVIQRQTSGSSTWTQVYSGTKVSSYTDSPGTGTYRYRSQASNVAGSSAWSSTTDWVTPMAPPSAPTLTAPASGSVHATGETVTLSWTHNPTDGSAQTKAEVGTSTDGGTTWTTSTFTTKTSTTLKVASSATVTWRVRTAGVSKEYGAYATSSYKVYVAPVVTVTVDETVEAIPFDISWSKGAADGSVASTALAIKDSDGATVWSASFGSGVASYAVKASDWIPSNGKTYTVEATVRSSVGLTGSGSASFSAAYEAPGKPVLGLTVDDETGAVSVAVNQEESDVATSYLTLARDGLTLASSVAVGTAVLDRTPALDRTVTYRAVAVAESGAVSEATETCIVPSNGFFFFNFGSNCAKAGMNASDKSSTKPEYTTTQAAGRTLPVVAYGEHRTTTGSFSAYVWWFDDIGGAGEAASFDRWKEFESHVGQAVMRRPMLEPMDVAVEVSVGIDAKNYDRAQVSVKWTEVDGDGLAR